jgi:hypothetical protein
MRRLTICALFIFITPLAQAAPDKCLSLRSAEESHRENPRTFSIPRSDERRNLNVGDIVKMVFEPCQAGESAERMWVIVKKRTERGYIGELNNHPATIENLELGDELEFGPEHVIATQTDKARFDPPEGRTVLVSAAIMKADAWPLFARRVATTRQGDSGWRVFSTRGAERAESLIEMPAEDLLDKFAVLDSILYERGTSAWVWNEADLEYRRVPDEP